MSTKVEALLERAMRRACAYRESLAARGPRPEASLEDLRARFCGPTPERGEDWASALDALADAAEPGLVAASSGRFFGWVMGGSHPVGVAADWLASAWGQNAGIYQTAPAAAIAEESAGRWLLDVLGLPEASSVGFVTGATMANFVCLAAARDEVLWRVGWSVEQSGLRGAPALSAYVGEEAHATVLKALHYLGIGKSDIVVVGADRDGRMNADALADRLGDSPGPAIVVAQAGQINTGAFDPLARLASISRAAGAWLHIDGAFGLWARACPERAQLAHGAENADSWSTDGHKWLQTPYDCGFAIVRDSAAHKRAMAFSASYLPEEDAPQPSHYTPELSRRARGFAVWAMLRALGREGIAQMIARHCACARHVAGRLAAEPGLEILNNVELNQVAIGFGKGWPRERQNAAARSAIEQVQRANRVFIGGADWRGRWIARVSVISGATQLADADLLADEIIAAWRAVRDGCEPSLLGVTHAVGQA